MVPNFAKGDQNKNECLVGLKRVPATDICLGGLLFLVKKDYVK